MFWSRRTFLRASLLGSTGLLASGGLDAVLAAIARGPRLRAGGYGPLAPDPAGLLDLPAGFQYRMFSSGILDADRAKEARFASTLGNGDPVPPQHDGMAAFEGPNGVTILVRNHELNLWDGPHVDARRTRPYDPVTGGGTTTLWVDAERRVVKSFASLSGTLRNCAGGRTPWNSWLTCEEITLIPGASDPLNADLDDRVQRRHGYVFEVDARATDLVEPIPLKALGRFRHEAVAVDPHTGFAYLTEDRDDGLLYRFRPDALAQRKQPSALRVGDYSSGGVLEALRVKSRPGLQAQNHPDAIAVRLAESLEVDWVRIPEVDPDMDMRKLPAPAGPQPDADTTGHAMGRFAPGAPGRPAPPHEQTASTSTRAQGFGLGCAQFARTEGIAFANGSVYFCCTNGGPHALGQVFRLDLRRQRLSLVVEPDDDALLDGPDNICVAPFGDLVVCEDNLARRENFLVGVTARGSCYPLARNAHAARREFAGACFSPDGRALFVNVQQPGMTFAIWGPWDRRRA